MAVLAAVLAAAAIFLFAAYAIRARALRPLEARLQWLSPQDQFRVEQTAQGEALLKRSSSSIPALRRFLTRNGYAERWALSLERAGLSVRPGEYFMIRVALGVGAAALIIALGRSAPAWIVALPIGAIAYMFPSYWVEFRILRRKRKIESQLVETIGLIANAVRSGFAFAQALDIAAKRIGPPMSDELSRMLLDINLGSSTEDALIAMNQRVDSEDLDMVVTAILIQRSTGGNLGEVLENVTETMRDRERIRGEIRTMTSQQRLTGWILSLWPALLGLGFYAINPKMVSLLWTTGAGLVLLSIWGVLNVTGIFVIRRILDIDI